MFPPDFCDWRQIFFGVSMITTVSPVCQQKQNTAFEGSETVEGRDIKVSIISSHYRVYIVGIRHDVGLEFLAT